MIQSRMLFIDIQVEKWRKCASSTIFIASSDSFTQLKSQMFSELLNQVLLRASCLVMSSSLQPHGLYVAWQASLSMEFFSKNTGAGRHSLLQGIFPTQELNPGLLHCSQFLYHLSHEVFFSDGSNQVLLTLKGGISVNFQLLFFLKFFIGC